MVSQLQKVLADRPGDLLVPDEKVKKGILEAVKQFLDPVAKSYSPLDEIHTDGLDIDQVWLQVLMAVDGAIGRIYDDISKMVPEQEDEGTAKHEEWSESDEELQSEADSSLQDPMQSNEDSLHEEEKSRSDASSDSQGSEYSDSEKDDDASTLDTRISEPEEVKGLEADGFNLADYQQQVLELEKNGEDGDEDIDYFAENPGSDDDEDEDLKYDDFFGSRRPRKQQKKHSSDSEEEINQADAAAQRDLFFSESEEEDDSQPMQGLSKFERQQHELEQQIRDLESENIGEKEWGMRGEIQASQRPGDSLIDADVEFERNAKPAPVITQEVTDSLEELIRDRVAKRLFNDLPKRSAALEPRQRPDLPELSDRKSENSLAEQYERDHLRSSNPDYFAKQDREKLDAAHREVVDLYSSLVRKLDSLCSWNYTPKAPKPSLEIRTEAPAISMEEAQPGTMATGSTFAPQEVYRPEAATKEEIIGPNGLPVARSELTPEERQRQRRRVKQKLRKSDKPEASESDKSRMFTQLQRGNVNLVDKKGQKRDMRGNIVKDNQPQQAASVKL